MFIGAAPVCALPVLRLLQLLIHECLFFQMILILPKQYSLSTATLGHVPSCSHNICWRLQAAVHTFFSPFLGCIFGVHTSLTNEPAEIRAYDL